MGVRPMYIGTSATLLASAIWMAKQNTRLDYIWNNFLSGIAGSLGDILVQLTVRLNRPLTDEESNNFIDC